MLAIDDAEHRHAYPGVREHAAIGGPRQATRPPPGLGGRGHEQLDPEGDLAHRAGDQPDANSDPEQREQVLRPGEPGRGHRGENGGAEGEDQPLRRGTEVPALPGQHRPERHNDQERRDQRQEDQVEERRADRDAVAGQRLEHQRVEGADQHRPRRRGQEQVVEDQRALAADRRKDAAGRRDCRRGRRRAPAPRR